MNTGLAEQELQLLYQIFSQHAEIEKVVLFGSRAMGNYRPNSDIDLVFWGHIDTPLHALIQAQLDELPLPYLFDTKIFSEITHSGLRQHIEQFGKEIHCSSFKIHTPKN